MIHSSKFEVIAPPPSTNRSTCINSTRPIHWRRLTDGRFARFPPSLAFSPLTYSVRSRSFSWQSNLRRLHPFQVSETSELSLPLLICSVCVAIVVGFEICLPIYLARKKISGPVESVGQSSFQASLSLI